MRLAIENEHLEVRIDSNDETFMRVTITKIDSRKQVVLIINKVENRHYCDVILSASILSEHQFAGINE